MPDELASGEDLVEVSWDPLRYNRLRNSVAILCKRSFRIEDLFGPELASYARLFFILKMC